MVCSYKHCWQYPCFDSQTEQERAFEFGRIFQEIETPTVMEQLHQLYAPVLEQDYVRFLLAVYHANELPDLAVGQRLKIFRHYYFDWEDEKLTIKVTRVKTHSDGRVIGEILVETTLPGTKKHIRQEQLNFSSGPTRVK